MVSVHGGHGKNNVHSCINANYMYRMQSIYIM
uniref:Uncharacterized protein n=1 Tax=Podoviridae sp. ct1ev3 TaxID=2825216 RepID=A0A8S5TT40_9CAUD|nr:MAG TPA: hypothetical protein [Podoviridae sp. ct1ev3]